jgi:hypothetical protein
MATQQLGIGRFQLSAPLANTFVTEYDASVEQDFLHILEVEAKMVIWRDGIVDTLYGKVKVMVQITHAAEELTCKHST